MVLSKLIALLLAMISVTQIVEEKKDHISFLMPKFIRGTLSSDFFASQLDAVDEVALAQYWRTPVFG